MSHLLGVASLVLEDRGSQDQAIAALLHDSIEDQGDGYPGGRDALRTEIAAQFGRLTLTGLPGDKHRQARGGTCQHPVAVGGKRFRTCPPGEVEAIGYLAVQARASARDHRIKVAKKSGGNLPFSLYY
jgi:hypothetical protein